MGKFSLVGLDSNPYLKADATFDCRRPNQACMNGGSCTFISADCACDPAYSGYDCGLTLADVDQNSCTPTTCLNGGTCYDDGTGAKCYCDSEHYGNTCEKNRFSLTCVADLMIIGVNPYSAAGYEAFVEDKQGVTGCDSQAVPAPVDTFDKIPDSWEGHYIQVEHDSAACGPSVPMITTGRKEFDRVVVVKYSPNVLTDIDDRYHVKCILEDNVVVESRVVKINVTGVVSQHVVSREDIAKAVDFYLLAGAGGGIYNGDPLDVGTELRFVFGIQGDTGADRSKVFSVSNDTKAPEADRSDEGSVFNDTQTLKPIEASCVHADGYPVIAEAVTPDPSNSREFNLRIRAFHFDGNDEVIFSFRVRVCVAADNSACDPATCTAPDGGYGRRKRDVGNDVQLYKAVKIRSGGGTQSNDNAIPKPNTIPGVTSTGCETSWEMTATLIAMAVAIFFLIVLAVTLIIIVVMFRHHRRKREAKIDVYVDPFSVEKHR
ncbi:EGF-like domain-containing protein 2 [Haliotis rubra]|uniref:EGF-like domain-containing protein 2 n=1 Tax=Haliotis rubra TaxID=36100 RepID=UPI001EE5425C|nr:EGF-like domain-containing protein 2 [Haliotis rubra]